MTMTNPEANPRAYGRPVAKAFRPTHVMTVLRDDSLAAVQVVMRQHRLSRSGAIHHLVRLGAGLDPLI